LTDAVLTINAGSSSIKVSLFEVGRSGLQPVLSGAVDSLGSSPRFSARNPLGAVLADRSWTETDGSFQVLMKTLLDWIEDHLGSDALVAVGHRVVHGGPEHVRPERVTPALLEVLDRLVPLAPLHEPHNIAPMRALAATHPALPQVACFDTAFHSTMPAIATRFALPCGYESEGIRRYGFHGLSYEYIAGRLRDFEPALAGGRVIAAHLGNGASLCAMLDGRSIDTTMGFSALDGLVMGTRCGTLDAGVVLYLLQEKGLTVDDTVDLLYRRSGLLGVSGGIASDMRILLASEDPHASEAVDLFCYRIAREVGALTSVLGGLDGLIFTAGIGEHAPEVRAKVCARLGWLGLGLDAAANVRGDTTISASGSRIAVRVIPTDEEAMIARMTVETIA
jgi:acetate kinase